MLAGGSRERSGERRGGRGGEESREKGREGRREREREIREGFSWVWRAERVPLPSFFLSRRMNSNRLIVRSNAVPTKPPFSRWREKKLLPKYGIIIKG